MIQKVGRVLILKHCSSPVCNSCSVGGSVFPLDRSGNPGWGSARAEALARKKGSKQLVPSLSWVCITTVGP